MDVLAEIRSDITGHVPEILQRFQSVLKEEPWMHLPQGYRAGGLSEFTPLAAELALAAESDAELCRRMLHSAARHGEIRLEQGFPDSLLFQEVYLLRQAIWSHIRARHDPEDPRAFEAIVRIDMALSLAAKAALRGFHRPTFERRGAWPRTIDDLVSEWKPLPPLA